MSDTILSIENVSKQYQLGTFGTGTIGRDVDRWFRTKVMGKEDPYLKIGQTNDRTSKEKADFVWALRDINFEVKRGEVLGIIGKNGAGKSTLLKLLSRVTGPTTGAIRSAGRMASLLEVGTGFHPELTGLENIYLNGAILGMTKAEIKRKLDEIIDFSGCALYIDTPVKRYSSGMTVRLGFAVAAFLDPEILVVDEVLAVGDAEFQKKAIGKMKDVSSSEGRTVLFVSHNMESVRRLCTNAILLNNGSVQKRGSVTEVITNYMKLNDLGLGGYMSDKNIPNYIQSIKLIGVNKKEQYTFNHTDEISIQFHIQLNEFVEGMSLFVMILDKNDRPVFPAEILVVKSQNYYTLKIKSPFLVRGKYSLESYLHIPKLKRFDQASACQFEVIDNMSDLIVHGDFNYGNVFGNCEWIV